MPNVPNSPESVFCGIQIYVNVSDSPEKDMRYYGIWFGMSVSPESDKYAVEMADITLLVRVAPVYLNCSDCLGRYVESFVDDTPTCG